MASRELSILITAKNLAARALGQVKGDIRGLESTAARAGSNIGRNIGLATAAVGGAIALNVKSGIDSLVELERVNNLTAAALESTGNRAQQSVDGIRARSEAMERMSGVDDKVIQNAQNLLLTFTQIGEDAFEPTLEAAVNLNAAMGGGDEGLQGVLLQVAKAVNDPIRGMTALRRSGVSFTEAQQKQVREMVEANDLMGAQALILGELETQFGGAAEAANQGVGGAQKRFADAIEDMQMSLATGFLPLIERVSDKMGELVADPDFLQGVEDFGETLAGGFDKLLDFAEDVDWGAIGDALKTAGGGAKLVMDSFLSAPAWLQTAILTGWGLNKVTGGVLGSLVGELGKGLIKGVLNMNAAVVNVNGKVVTGGPGGGVPAAPGGGGLGRSIATGAAVGLGVGLTAVAAVEVVNFENMRTESRERLQGILDEMPRTPERIDESIEAIQAQIDMERPLLDGILFNTNVRPQLEDQIDRLNEVKAAQERGVAAARDAIPWAQRNVAEVHSFNMSEGTRFANLGTKVNATTSKVGEVRSTVAAQKGVLDTISGIESANSGKLSSILAKKSSVTVNTKVYTTVNVSAAQMNQQLQSYRESIGQGGFI